VIGYFFYLADAATAAAAASSSLMNPLKNKKIKITKKISPSMKTSLRVRVFYTAAAATYSYFHHYRSYYIIIIGIYMSSVRGENRVSARNMIN
jgi:hypothetical protein